VTLTQLLSLASADTTCAALATANSTICQPIPSALASRAVSARSSAEMWSCGLMRKEDPPGAQCRQETAYERTTGVDELSCFRC
jgi:hypothetical protein